MAIKIAVVWNIGVMILDEIDFSLKSVLLEPLTEFFDRHSYKLSFNLHFTSSLYLQALGAIETSVAHENYRLM